MRQKIEQAKYELEKAQRNYDLNTAAQLQHGTIPQLERQLAEAEKALEGRRTANRLLKEEVDEEDVAAIVSPLDPYPREQARGRRKGKAPDACQRTCTSV